MANGHRVTNEVLAERIAGLRNDVVAPGLLRLGESIQRIEERLDWAAEHNGKQDRRIVELEYRWKFLAKVLGGVIALVAVTGTTIGILSRLGIL